MIKTTGICSAVYSLYSKLETDRKHACMTIGLLCLYGHIVVFYSCNKNRFSIRCVSICNEINVLRINSLQTTSILAGSTFAHRSEASSQSPGFFIWRSVSFVSMSGPGSLKSGMLHFSNYDHNNIILASVI
jgi:hypothetical protein